MQSARTMRILHYYDQHNELQAHYVHLLEETMSGSAELATSSSLQEVRQQLSSRHFDLLHIHGCWSQRYAKAASVAHRYGTRVIITPHGELEPWVLKDREWQEKLPKTLLYQRRTIEQAYVVIAMGKMETECLHKLGWNPRIETVHNALITHSISREEMTRQLFVIYQRVMDSDQLSLMSPEKRDLLFLLLKAGVCSNREWLESQRNSMHNGELKIDNYDYTGSSKMGVQANQNSQFPILNSQFPIVNDRDWRQYFIYARDEQVEDLLRRGLRVLNITAPYMDVSGVESYFPTGYEQPKSIASVIGNQYATETERLLATFRHLQHLIQHNRMSVCHLLELEKEIREHEIDEALLAETLQENRLLRLAQRLMGMLQRLTGFEEGMMPVAAIDDNETTRIETMITKHLAI